MDTKCVGYCGEIKKDKVIITKCNQLKYEQSSFCKNHNYFYDLTKSFFKEVQTWDTTKENNNKVSYCNCGCFTPFSDKLIKTTCIVCENRPAPKCGWVDKQLQPCKFLLKDSKQYCNHHLYVEKYTQKQKDDSKVCNGCRKVKYIVAPAKQCQECKNDDKLKRDTKVAKVAILDINKIDEDDENKVDNVEEDNKNKEKNKKVQIVRPSCVIAGCVKSAHKDAMFKYCYMHIKHYIKSTALTDPNNKMCSNFDSRGCVVILTKNDYYNTCMACRDKDKQKYGSRQHDKK